MRALVLLGMAACGGIAEPCTWLTPGSYEVTQTVVETTCATEHVGDVSTGIVDFTPDACRKDGCVIVCDAPGAATTTWEATGPGQARVTFVGGCRVVYAARMVAR